MPAFHLSKWYLDCVTDSGDSSIAYIGTVDWVRTRLHYASLLETTAGVVRSRRSLRSQIEPILVPGSLGWHSNALRVDCEWQADSAEIRETIFASGAGSVEWHCLMPRAHARMQGRFGLGYAEHITMTVAPWKLPIQTLRWGRFLAPSDWIVWIDWLGNFSRRLVYWNGQTATVVKLQDDEIEFSGGTRLVMDRSLCLRQGPLGATALSAIPGLRNTYPARILRLNECKWVSHARLEQPGASPVEAWAIHERVDWPE